MTEIKRTLYISAQFESVHVGHIDITDNQVDVRTLEQTDCLFTAVSGLNALEHSFKLIVEGLGFILIGTDKENGHVVGVEVLSHAFQCTVFRFGSFRITCG